MARCSIQVVRCYLGALQVGTSTLQPHQHSAAPSPQKTFFKWAVKHTQGAALERCSAAHVVQHHHSTKPVLMTPTLRGTLHVLCIAVD